VKAPLPPVGTFPTTGLTLRNIMRPPGLMKVPLPAVELFSKMIKALLVKAASPAVAALTKFTWPLLVKAALSAVEVPPKVMAPLLVKAVKLPAVALLRKVMNVLPELGAKFCTIPELFVMPTPLMVNVGVPSGKSIVNALALRLEQIGRAHV